MKQQKTRHKLNLSMTSSKRRSLLKKCYRILKYNYDQKVKLIIQSFKTNSETGTNRNIYIYMPVNYGS